MASRDRRLVTNCCILILFHISLVEKIRIFKWRGQLRINKLTLNRCSIYSFGNLLWHSPCTLFRSDLFISWMLLLKGLQFPQNRLSSKEIFYVLYDMIEKIIKSLYYLYFFKRVFGWEKSYSLYMFWIFYVDNTVLGVTTESKEKKRGIIYVRNLANIVLLNHEYYTLLNCVYIG